jgi:hypothetical protein
MHRPNTNKEINIMTGLLHQLIGIVFLVLGFLYMGAVLGLILHAF